MRSATAYTISYFRAISWAVFFYLILFVVVAFLADAYSPTDEILAVSAILGWLVSMPVCYYLGIWLASRRFLVVMAGNRIELTDKEGFSNFFDLDQVDKEVGFSGLRPRYISIFISGSKEKLYGRIFPFVKNKAFSELAVAVRDVKNGWDVKKEPSDGYIDLSKKDRFLKGEDKKWQRNLSMIVGALELISDLADAFI
jgi:hypothetical protein